MNASDCGGRSHDAAHSEQHTAKQFSLVRRGLLRNDGAESSHCRRESSVSIYRPLRARRRSLDRRARTREREREREKRERERERKRERERERERKGGIIDDERDFLG